MTKLTKEELKEARVHWHGQSYADLFDTIDAPESELHMLRIDFDIWYFGLYLNLRGTLREAWADRPRFQ